ncbi:MAG: Gfo/Idh/MocA family oxidoreductase [Planctomycetota bacterium]
MIGNAERIRLGLIGAGNLARTRAKCAAGTPNAELAAVASRTREKAQRFADEHGIRAVFADHRELIASDVDAVIVATPNDTHYPIVMDALRGGKDVLVEYPMVLHAEQAAEIVRLTEERKAIVEVGFDTRFDPLDRELREFVSSGRIGEPVWCSAQLLYPVPCDPAKWYSNPKATRGMIVSWLVERFDLLRRVCGEVESVFAVEAPDAYGGKKFFEQRICIVNLRFQSGAVGAASLCCLAPRGLSGSVVQVIGREGGLWSDGRALRVFSRAGEESIRAESGVDSFAEETAHFVRCVRERTPVENPPAESLKALQVAEAALASLRDGKM